ncbi:MAG: hypothetical protein IJI61_06205 [Oscillospiraceae bacterium]|nr:hypothetical protein [Oscillospiraceae bacterium]
MRKTIAMLLAMLMLFSLSVSAFAEAELPADELSAEKAAEETEEEEIVYPDELLVGHPTTTRGDFFTEMFGNDTADIDVRALIHGYNLVNWDQNQGVYVIDPTIVTEVKVVEDDVGNRSYFMALAEDLYFSDGTPITAWDYAFSLLLMMAPEIEEIGGKIYRAEHILGYDDYINGDFPSLTGVEVLSDHQLVITLDHEFLPYFFEIGLLLCVPYPIYVIAPGCKVYDDGYGVYIGNEDQSIEEPIFTAELLRKTILDPETGYNSHPSVCSGPYVLTSYDGTTCHFELNPYFKGAWVSNNLVAEEGEDAAAMDPEHPEVGGGVEQEERIVIPTIEKIAFTVVDNDEIAEKFEEGELHLVNKVVYGPAIMELMQGTETVKPRFQNYPRIGLAFLTFSYDWPTVHEMEVRQAIAWCMDREQLTQDYTQGFGITVDGYYGIEQWEYLLVTHQIDYPVNFLDEVLKEGEDEEEYTKLKNRYVKDDKEYDRAIAAWEMLTLDNLVHYGVYDLEKDPDRTEKIGIKKANALLDDAKWTLNREGGTYRPGVDDVRCKEIDGKLVALDLTMMYPEGNHIVDTIQENFIDNLNECGIQLTLVPTPMQELFKAYYRETERTTDMIYLATNFHVIVDPSITYYADDEATHLMWNNTYSDDEDLYWRAENMRKTEPGDIYDYVSKWVSFQERYNEVLPTIPVYSNIYFDFYVPELQNYHITAHVTWTQAILESYWGEDPVEEVTEEEDMELEEEFEGDDLVEFDDF